MIQKISSCYIISVFALKLFPGLSIVDPVPRHLMVETLAVIESSLLIMSVTQNSLADWWNSETHTHTTESHFSYAHEQNTVHVDDKGKGQVLLWA